MKRLTSHFSVDDVFESLIEVSDRKIRLFDHPFFRFLKKLHDDYGATVECYLFYQNMMSGRLRRLTEVSSHIKETIARARWLRFGPHALDYPHAPYDQKPAEIIKVFDTIYSEITRFAGNENFSSFARLHYFSEMYELASYFKKRNVSALFTTDKPAMSWRMPDFVKDALRESGVGQYKGMTFIRTHFRVEYFIHEHPTTEERNKFLKHILDDYGFIAFFTHECDVANPQVRDATMAILKKCKTWGLKSV